MTVYNGLISDMLLGSSKRVFIVDNHSVVIKNTFMSYCVIRKLLLSFCICLWILWPYSMWFWNRTDSWFCFQFGDWECRPKCARFWGEQWRSLNATTWITQGGSPPAIVLEIGSNDLCDSNVDGDMLVSSVVEFCDFFVIISGQCSVNLCLRGHKAEIDRPLVCHYFNTTQMWQPITRNWKRWWAANPPQRCGDTEDSRMPKTWIDSFSVMAFAPIQMAYLICTWAIEVLSFISREHFTQVIVLSLLFLSNIST